MKKALVALIATYAAMALTVAATYPLLPGRVATHYGADGLPNAWDSRSAYMSTMFAGAALIAAACAGTGYALRWLPDSMVNIPHRDHWLAPERRGETDDRLFTLGLALGAATTGLFIAMHLLTVRASLRNPPRMAPVEGIGLLVASLGVLGGLAWGVSRAWRIEIDERS